jgi:hypothetical protein
LRKNNEERKIKIQLLVIVAAGPPGIEGVSRRQHQTSNFGRKSRFLALLGDE